MRVHIHFVRVNARELINSVDTRKLGGDIERVKGVPQGCDLGSDQKRGSC